MEELQFYYATKQDGSLPSDEQLKRISVIMALGYELKATVPVTSMGTLLGVQFYFQLRPKQNQLFTSL